MAQRLNLSFSELYSKALRQLRRGTPRRHAIRVPLTQRPGPREHGEPAARRRSRCAGARRLGAVKITSFDARAWHAWRQRPTALGQRPTAPSENTTAPSMNTTLPGMNTTAPSQHTTRAETVHDLLWSGAHCTGPEQVGFWPNMPCIDPKRTCAAPEQVTFWAGAHLRCARAVMFWPQHGVLWLNAVKLRVRAGHALGQSRSCSGSAR